MYLYLYIQMHPYIYNINASSSSSSGIRYLSWRSRRAWKICSWNSLLQLWKMALKSYLSNVWNVSESIFGGFLLSSPQIQGRGRNVVFQGFCLQSYNPLSSLGMMTQHGVQIAPQNWSRLVQAYKPSISWGKECGANDTLATKRGCSHFKTQQMWKT